MPNLAVQQQHRKDMGHSELWQTVTTAVSNLGR